MSSHKAYPIPAVWAYAYGGQPQGHGGYGRQRGLQPGAGSFHFEPCRFCGPRGLTSSHPIGKCYVDPTLPFYKEEVEQWQMHYAKTVEKEATANTKQPYTNVANWVE